MKRWYTKKSYKLMTRVRIAILFLTCPLWIPFYVISFIGYYADDFLMVMDKFLVRVLDKNIPQLK